MTYELVAKRLRTTRLCRPLSGSAQREVHGVQTLEEDARPQSQPSLWWALRRLRIERSSEGVMQVMLDTSPVNVFRRVRLGGDALLKFKESEPYVLVKLILGFIYMMLISASASGTAIASPNCDSETFDNFVDRHKEIAQNAHDRGDHRVALREYKLIAENFSRCAESDISKRTQAGIQAGNTDPAALHQTHENTSYGEVATYYSFAVDDARALHDRSLTCSFILHEASALQHTETRLEGWSKNFPSEVKACRK